MANISDLKQVGDDLLPLIKSLFSQIRSGNGNDVSNGVSDVVAKLRNVASTADQSTAASLNERVEAIVASHTALTEVLIEANSGHFSPEEAALSAVRVQRRALDDALGEVLAKSTFSPIGSLLTTKQIGKIEETLQKADDDIDARADAKAMLDRVIDIATTTATIAVRLA